MRTGVPSSISRTFLYIRPSLLAALQHDAPCKPARLPRVFNGMQVARPERRPGEDQLILEIRRLHEQENKKLLAIQEIVQNLGFVKTKSWVRQVVNYYSRAHLVPAAGAPPYLKVTS